MRLTTALLAIASLALCACAPAADERAAAGEPALWRIADDDSDIYLFGTVHVLPPALVWRGPRFEAAFASADELVVEIDTAAGDRGLAERLGTLPAGQRLSDLLMPPQRARLERVCAGLGVAPAALQSKRPWLAAMQLSLAHAVANGFDPAAGVENVLVPEARARGLRLSYLETAEQQVRLLAGFTPEQERAFLAASLRQIEEDENSLAVLAEAWARGDTSALDAMSRTQLGEAGEGVYAALITDRNVAWANAIAHRLQGEGRIFYAVGAAHLVGDGGVVALLRARGVRVEGP